MANNTSDSLLTICKLLQTHQVLYLLVGGTAVALNGYFRLSINDSGELTEKPDIDVWFHPAYENYFKLIGVIEELGYDVSEYKNEKSPDPHSSFFKLKFDEFSLDLIPQIKWLITLLYSPILVKFYPPLYNRNIVHLATDF